MKINAAEFDLLRNYIESQCGITVSEDKKYLIETRLTRLVAEAGARSFGDFYRKVAAARDPKLRDRIVDAMTTNETLWFRDSSPFLAFKEKILPEAAKRAKRDPRYRLRVWSAACSTGQEPYSLAMLANDFSRGPFGRDLSSERVDLFATDISPSALFIAMAGRYDRISMRRGLTGPWAGFKTRYFTDKGRVSLVNDDIKGRVRFMRFNLQGSFASLGRFDVIFLRNVAIYFSEQFKRDLFEKLYRSLNPGGYLVLGTAESTSGYSNRFIPENHGRAVLYRPRR